VSPLSLVSGQPSSLAKDPFGSRGAHSSTNFPASSQINALSIRLRVIKRQRLRRFQPRKTGRRCPLEYDFANPQAEQIGVETDFASSAPGNKTSSIAPGIDLLVEATYKQMKQMLFFVALTVGNLFAEISTTRI
jgi:hypothetical protein